MAMNLLELNSTSKTVNLRNVKICTALQQDLFKMKILADSPRGLNLGEKVGEFRLKIDYEPRTSRSKKHGSRQGTRKRSLEGNSL